MADFRRTMNSGSRLPQACVHRTLIRMHDLLMMQMRGKKKNHFKDRCSWDVPRTLTDLPEMCVPGWATSRYTSKMDPGHSLEQNMETLCSLNVMHQSLANLPGQSETFQAWKLQTFQAWSFSLFCRVFHVEGAAKLRGLFPKSVLTRGTDKTCICANAGHSTYLAFAIKCTNNED